VRRTLRDLFSELEKDHPHLKETLLSAMGNVETQRLLDPRFLDLDGHGDLEGGAEPNPLTVLSD
jgi:tRNA 2-thiocytidine biosynthesis protein TtcA